MKVLLTGGTGFIGKHLVPRLLGRGHDVTILSRDPGGATKRRRAIPNATRVLAWNPTAGPAPPDALSGTDAVVNLLGESIAGGRWTAAKKERILESRVVGTRHLVAGIAGASPRPRVLVSSSAIGYYGPRGDEEIDEGSPSGGDFLAGVAREWEAEARRAEDHLVRVALLRTGIVLGRGGGALQSMLLPFRFGVGGPIGSGQQWMSWIHVDDLCGLVLHALDRPEVTGPLNGTSPQPVRNREFAKSLGRALGRPSLLPTPAFVLRALLGEMADALLLSGQRVLPKKALETGYRFSHPYLDQTLASILQSG